MCFKFLKTKQEVEYSQVIKQILNSIEMAYSIFNEIDFLCCFEGQNIHLDKTYVKDVNPNLPTSFFTSFISQITEYLICLNNYLSRFDKIKEQIDNEKLEFNYRIKDFSSIMQKLKVYIEKTEKGECPLNKCLNDLFGMRIIVNCSSFNLIRKKMKDALVNDKRFKIVDRFKESYRAIHIYFKKNNFTFRWEFQIWLKSNEKEHKLSHKKYKQGYTKWEKQYKNARI